MATPHLAISQATWRRSLRPWIALQELPKHLANLLPFALGSILAWWDTGRFDWAVCGVALLALFFLTDGTYIANEYFDYESDKANLTRIGGADGVGVTTTGGTRVLVKELIPRRHALIAALVAFALAIPPGLVLRYALGTGPLTIPLGLLALFIGWFYTAPPIRACYRGLGELFIAIGQGLVVFGGYYVQADFSMLPLVVSLPWFLALPALKILREFPDYEADRLTGKRGLTLRLGREPMAVVSGGLMLLAVLGFVPMAGLLGPWFTLPLVVPAVLLLRSAATMLSGGWRDPALLEAGAVSGFTGMLFIPAAQSVAFMLSAIIR